MKIRQFLVLCAACLLSGFCTLTQAQEFSFTEAGPINIGTTFSFQSEILSEERTIHVALPDDYQTSDKRYPVVYLLDAQYFFQFQYAYGKINALAFMEEMPEVILVGVHSADRLSDMTPASPTNEGNADRFIDFLGNELQVFIDQQFRTQPYRILIGHSAGGAFALRTLFHAPDTFNGYIAMSPALQWDKGKPFNDLTTALDAGIEFNNTLFMSIADEGGEMLAYYERIIDLLTEADPNGLTYTHKTFPDENHSSTTMTGIHHGLLSMYENWMPPTSTDSLEALLSHYRNLSEHYGYTVSVSMTHASDVGFALLREGEPEKALEVFEYMLAHISQGALAHYHVAFALRRLGRLEEALAEFDKAIELGPATDMFDVFVRFRDEVAQEISALETNE